MRLIPITASVTGINSDVQRGAGLDNGANILITMPPKENMSAVR